MNAVTVSRNVADSNSDASGTGGGVYLDSTSGSAAHVGNSLLALNRVNFNLAAGLDCATAGPSFDSLGHNLLTANGGSCPGFSAPGDIVRAQPRIGKLADNGGPTETVALRRGSPAISHAGASAPGRDQRGHKRDPHPDAGAFER